MFKVRFETKIDRQQDFPPFGVAERPGFRGSGSADSNKGYEIREAQKKVASVNKKKLPLEFPRVPKPPHTTHHNPREKPFERHNSNVCV